MRLLDALTTAELAVEARVGKKVNRLHGPVWARGVAAEQGDEYGDLFGSARAGARTVGAGHVQLSPWALVRG
jgi:hypothetical protein